MVGLATSGPSAPSTSRLPLLGAGRRLVVVETSEVEDDLVRHMTEVLTSLCARLYGRRSARTRAQRALRCAAATPEVA